jgi:hypothetical protein
MEWIGNTGKIIAVVLASVTLSGLMAPCSASYNFITKTEASAIHEKIKERHREAESKLTKIDTRQQEIREDVKSILEHLLRGGHAD